MIITFPMLTSNNTSSTALPGICKMLEKFIIVYNLDRVLKHARKVSDMERVGSTLRLREAKIKADIKPIPINISTGSDTKDKPDVSSPPKIDQALALEPTWVKVELKDGFAVLGVKVVPFPVLSDENVISLMMKDLSLSFWKKTMTKWQRAAMRRVWTVIRGVGGRLGYKGGALTGDPKRDVLFATSEHRHNIFTLINMIDLQNAEDFLKNAGGIKKLYSLGWRSFIVTDDIKHQASFCLEQFKGMCSTIPYSFIYSSLGAGHQKVYEDLEDVRKSGSSFFKMKGNVRKIFGESEDMILPCCGEKLQEAEVITEDFATIAQRFKSGIPSMFSGLRMADKKADKNMALKVLSKLPKMGLEKIITICQKMAPEFKSNFEMANRVFANSIEGPADLKRSCACIIAMGASYRNETGKSRQQTIDGIKKFVVAARQTSTAKDFGAATGIPSRPGGTTEPGGAEEAAAAAVSSIFEWIAYAVSVVKQTFANTLAWTSADKQQGGAIGKTVGFIGKQSKTIGDALKEAWDFCRQNDIIYAIVIVVIVFIIIAYLCRNS